MSSTPPNMKTICSSFPGPLSLHIIGEPLIQQIVTNHPLQYENAAFLLYFEQHGFLTDTLIDAQHVAFMGAGFISIANPGPICLPLLKNASP